MSATQPADISAHAGSPRTSSSDQRYSDSEKSGDGDVDSEKPDIGVENSFAPIKPATTADNTHLQRLHSAASRPIERSWSLNDGYSCNNEADAEANAGGPQGPDTEDDFTVRWEENDPDNPRNFNTLNRWMIVIICSMGSLCVTCTSSMYTFTYDQLTQEFGCSRLIATLGLSFFIWGLGVGPLFLGPLSEFYGRRNIYLTSFTLFLIWLIPCAVAKNIETMIVCRFLNGLAGSAFLSVAGGTVGDLFARQELGAPMMLYSSAPFIGPELGPLVGGFINEFTTWRWTFYVLLIWTGILLAMLALFVPETYHPVLLRRKAQRLRKETGDDRWQAPIEKLDRSITRTVLQSLYRPVLLLTLEPMCLNLCIYSAILLGILYLFFGAFQLVFGNVYDFNLYQRGLAFLGLFVGMAFAIASDPFWRRIYRKLEATHERAVGVADDFQPEWRLPPAIAGAPLVTIGLFIFAWTIYPSVHWIVPIIGSAFFGAGTVLIYSGVFSFLVDAYPLMAASALSANSFARSSFGGIFPLFGIQMYNRLGYNWATTLLAFLTLAMAPFPYIFFRYGSRIRKKSRFATG
ncbi:MFS transporter [Aspergillus stella-maris]|uniref:MFS transporter n=1 Tax=Aspergillus stella-maris TaxID=1810926 RepID=UPI003CCD12C7